jgi:hypothetical protein
MNRTGINGLVCSPGNDSRGLVENLWLRLYSLLESLSPKKCA